MAQNVIAASATIPGSFSHELATVSSRVASTHRLGASLRKRGSSLGARCIASPPAPSSTLSSACRVRDFETLKPSVDRISHVQNKAGFAAALDAAGEDLVVVEYTKASLPNTKTLPTLTELSLAAPKVQFLRVMGDQSEELRQLCLDAQVTRIPSFAFYKKGEMVHLESGLDQERLKEELLYYGANEYPVEQLHSKEDFEGFIEKHNNNEGKLVVVTVSLKFCGPCVRVYPTVLQLSHKMADKAVFGRMFGDENESCQRLTASLKIVEAPTFLFYRNGELLGRYVGSGRGDLIGEILKHQGIFDTVE